MSWREKRITLGIIFIIVSFVGLAGYVSNKYGDRFKGDCPNDSELTKVKTIVAEHSGILSTVSDNTREMIDLDKTIVQALCSMKDDLAELSLDVMYINLVLDTSVYAKRIWNRTPEGFIYADSMDTFITRDDFIRGK